MMFDEGDYYYSLSEVFTSISSISSSKKAKMMNKRRFSDEQVRSLECIFENETKLEPKKKLQLARELGLQPRQIAIWFQNKRARYKSKQLETDYNILRANYNALSSQFENLKKEKQCLIIQLEKLKELVAKEGDYNQCSNNSSVTNSSDETQSEINKIESDDDVNKIDQGDLKPTLSIEGSEYGASILSDEGSSENTNYFGMEEVDILTMVQPVVGGSMTTNQGWDDLHPNNFFDQPVDSNQWFEFWS